MPFYIDTLESRINTNELLLAYKKRRPSDILNNLAGTYSVEMKILYSDPNNSLVQAGSHQTLQTGTILKIRHILVIMEIMQ